MIQLNRLHNSTMKIAERINDADAEELATLVELREEVLEQLRIENELSSKQKEILIEIHKHDEIIVSRMMWLKDEASQVLNKIARSRVQKNKYESQYAAESYFFDKRE